MFYGIYFSQCELVVLTKEDYDSILKTELSQEVKEKVETLKVK